MVTDAAAFPCHCSLLLVRQFAARPLSHDLRMKILHLSKMDTGGGAADGFVRIHVALLAEGVESAAYVMKRRRMDVPMVAAVGLLGPWARVRWVVGRLLAKALRFGAKVEGVYDLDSEANFPAEPIIRHARARHEQWDFVVVHWSGGFVRPETVRAIAQALGARVALWQVDMAHATGGCHSNLGCEKYRTGCGACPLIGSQDPHDVSAIQAARRQQTWRELDAVVLAPSSWSARQAKESFTLGGRELAVFPIPLNLAVLRPTDDVAAARRALGIPESGRVALVRALDPAITYKGFGLFLQALRLLDAQGVVLHVAVVGDRGFVPTGLRHLTFTELGPQRGDAAMARAYQACDFFVSPSTNETGPMMAGEAMACARPFIAFPIGIAPDLIDGNNGILVEPVGDVSALASALRTYAEMPAAHLAAAQGVAAARARAVFSAAYFTRQFARLIRP